MNLLHEFPEETAEETMKYIDKNKNWSYFLQDYKIPIKEETSIENSVNIFDAKIYLRGQYFIVEYNNMVHYWEHSALKNFTRAYELLSGKKENWKTIAILSKLASSLREIKASGSILLINEVEFNEKICQTVIKAAQYIGLSKHGKHTF